MSTKRGVPGDGGIVKVAFDLPAAVQAEDIALCGDFNHWSRTETMLKRGSNRVWRVTVPLQAGRSYRYRYLLDGKSWENDWSADSYVRNSYGSEDSVVSIPAKRPPKMARPEARAARRTRRAQSERPAADDPTLDRADADHGQAPGMQGANVGYWQAVGSTRAAAKRSKRP